MKNLQDFNVHFLRNMSLNTRKLDGITFEFTLT